VGRRGAVVSRPPALRLPAGWHALDPVEGCAVAVLPAADGPRPAGVLSVTALTGDDRSPADMAAGVLDDLRTSGGAYLVLDEEPTRCRGGTPAHRVLTAHTAHDRGITTELWLVGGAAPAALCAAVDTARYAEIRPALHRALRSYRP
jgi:hypothetical protein